MNKLTIETKNMKFNDLAKLYFETKDPLLFDKIYLELRKIGQISKVGLTVETDDLETITTDLALKLLKDFDSLYTEKKSLFSYCMVAFKTKFYSLLKKYNQRVRESDLMRDDEDGSNTNSFEALIYSRSENEEIDYEVVDMLHNSDDKKLKEFYDVIDYLFPDEKEMMRDIFTFREDDEVVTSAIWTSPENICAKYGIKNRSTISAKRSRALQKIIVEMENRKKLSEFIDGNLDDGIVKNGAVYIELSNKKIVKSQSKNGNVVERQYDENGHLEITTSASGILVSKGNKDLKGNRTGVWEFYKDNGKIDGKINYDHKMQFVTFDQYGTGEQIGKLK